MEEQKRFTVGQVARLYSTDDWRIRRIVDDLDADLPRAGQYRLIPRAMLGTIAVQLKKRGWLKEVAANG